VHACVRIWQLEFMRRRLRSDCECWPWPTERDSECVIGICNCTHSCNCTLMCIHMQLHTRKGPRKTRTTHTHPRYQTHIVCTYVHKQKALILIGTTTITYHFTMLLVFFFYLLLALLHLFWFKAKTAFSG